jgi:hypothetical protein
LQGVFCKGRPHLAGDAHLALAAVVAGGSSGRRRRSAGAVIVNTRVGPPGGLEDGGGKPRIDLVEAPGPVMAGSLCFTPVPVKHGGLDILGWRINEGPAHGPVRQRFALPTSATTIFTGI